MNDVSWGTRETAPTPATGTVQANTAVTHINSHSIHRFDQIYIPFQANVGPQTRIQKLMANFSSKGNEEEGAIDFSFGGIFRCMFCARPKPNKNDILLTQLSGQIEMLSEKISLLDAYATRRSFRYNIATSIFIIFFISNRKREEPMAHDSDNLSIIDLEGQRDSIIDEFDSDNEEIDHSHHLPHWLADDDLKNSETETLPAAEEQFWLDLIQKYLEPIEPSDEEKVNTIKLICVSIQSMLTSLCTFLCTIEKDS